MGVRRRSSRSCARSCSARWNGGSSGDRSVVAIGPPVDRSLHPETRHRKRCLGLREELVRVLQRMAAGGLVAGTEGNASARAGELVVVSPTALPYDTLRPEDVCLVTVDGEIVE